MWKRKCGATMRYEHFLVKSILGKILGLLIYYFRLSDIILLNGHNMLKKGTLGIHVAHEKSDQQRISKAYLNRLNNSNTSYEDVFKIWERCLVCRRLR